jgi:threonine/homoserine/homoserine lactone efflux protein
MSSVASFVLAVLALLVVPGPTNTLLAASGAAVGMRKSLKLLPMELGGYLIAIALWGHVIGPLVSSYSVFPTVSKLLASLYLVWSAIQLWRHADASLTDSGGLASPRRVFVTTLLNPKALIFALVIFPQTGLSGQAPYASVFAVIVVAIACGWIFAGTLLARSSRGVATPGMVSRIAAMALGLFAVLLAGSAVAASMG